MFPYHCSKQGAGEFMLMTAARLSKTLITFALVAWWLGGSTICSLGSASWPNHAATVLDYFHPLGCHLHHCTRHYEELYFMVSVTTSKTSNSQSWGAKYNKVQMNYELTWSMSAPALLVLIVYDCSAPTGWYSLSGLFHDFHSEEIIHLLDKERVRRRSPSQQSEYFPLYACSFVIVAIIKISTLYIHGMGPSLYRRGWKLDHS